MIFVQLKQVFSCERVEQVEINVMVRTEDHHRETALRILAARTEFSAT